MYANVDVVDDDDDGGDDDDEDDDDEDHHVVDDDVEDDDVEEDDEKDDNVDVAEDEVEVDDVEDDEVKGQGDYDDVENDDGGGSLAYWVAGVADQAADRATGGWGVDVWLHGRWGVSPAWSIHVFIHPPFCWSLCLSDYLSV